MDITTYKYIFSFILALLLSLYGTVIAKKAALKFNIVDRPDGKLKTHKEPVPYLGGLAVYLSFLLTLALTFEFSKEVLGLMLAGSIIVMLGLLDDMKALTPGVKIIGQLIAIVVLVKSGIMIELSAIPEWLRIIITCIWLLGMINAINIIDVMDGLATGVSALASIFFFVVAVMNDNVMIAMLTITLAGSLIGFLRYNFNPAKIYLGDTGSLFLGLMLGSLAMIGKYTKINSLGFVAPLLILSVPLFDVALVSFLRFRSGQPVYKGSKDHFALRLQKRGLSVKGTAIFSYILTIIGSGIAILFITVKLKLWITILILVFCLLFAILFARWLAKVDMRK